MKRERSRIQLQLQLQLPSHHPVLLESETRGEIVYVLARLLVSALEAPGRAAEGNDEAR